jgi:hypothetical protein
MKGSVLGKQINHFLPHRHRRARREDGTRILKIGIGEMSRHEQSWPGLFLKKGAERWLIGVKEASRAVLKMQRHLREQNWTR